MLKILKNSLRLLWIILYIQEYIILSLINDDIFVKVAHFHHVQDIILTNILYFKILKLTVDVYFVSTAL